MDHAWLDSLSEDWVSQPRSESPALSLPSFSNSTTEPSKVQERSSRIPIFSPQKQAWTAPQEANSSPLSERSLNDHNIPLSQRSSRQPSKLRGEISSNSIRGRQLSQTITTSTTQSSQYHTIQHKSVSLSPKKESGETPEWRRRLLQGDVAYGEQRDLFSPAGLESIFKPPPTQTSSRSPAQAKRHEDISIMPSSPPPYNFGRRLAENTRTTNHDEEEEECGQESQQPRQMKYNLVDEGGNDFSVNDIDKSSNLRLHTRSGPNQGRSSQSEAPSEFESSIVRNSNPRDGRTVSGQSDFRNEEFSPVFVTKHNTIDEKHDYGALGLQPAELQRRLEHVDEKGSMEIDQDGTGNDISRAAPENVTIDTENYTQNAGFINIRRGGYSQEGSFHQRMLSSSTNPVVDESAMLPEESMQASTPKELPNIKKTRASNEYQPTRETQGASSALRTPHPSPRKSGEKGSGGSPLKLFGNYDTFTNQKLLRRLSQFEGDYDDNSAPAASQESTRTEANEAFVSASSSQKSSQHSHAHRSQPRKVTSFGEGDLDSFQFSEEISYNPSESHSEEDDMGNTSLPVLNPNAQSRFKFQLEPSPALQDGVFAQRQEKYTTFTTNTTKQTITVSKPNRPCTGSSVSTGIPSSRLVEDLQTPRKRNGDLEGKRLPKSPLKDPTPKRRRTLNKTEVANGEVDYEAVNASSLKETHHQMQSVIGRKRKDARHDDDQQAANPKVLAMRQILRPRTPTPSQRSSVQLDHEAFQDIDMGPSEQARLTQERKIAKIQAELDSMDPLRDSKTLAVGQHVNDESRKPSVTTQDFLDEAKKIMAGIRGKARSGLASLEESDSENDRVLSPDNAMPGAELEESYQESTKEPFSRPPSREGKPIERVSKMQEDPKLLDHLRKYEEKSDIDIGIGSSVRSGVRADVDVAKSHHSTNDRFSGKEHQTESDPPNIRISENPEMLRKRKHSTSSAPTGNEEHEFPSQGSNASSNQSISQSIPTGSSRGSDSRRNIAPHSVSHLIPEQLAGMVFDRERNGWFKRKTVSGEMGELNWLPSDETEDDPFGDIPDLSVDETQELQRLKRVAAKEREEARIAGQQYRVEPINLVTQQSTTSMPDTEQNIAKGVESPSSELSKVAQFASSSAAPTTHTQATSWGEKSAPTSKSPSAPHPSNIMRDQSSIREKVSQEQDVEEVEREISIHEDRIDTGPRRRNVTISFSSPVASVMNPSGYDRHNSPDEECEASQLEDFYHDDINLSNGSVIIKKRASSHQSASAKTRTVSRTASRHISLDGHRFSNRPVSRIDEREEESFSTHENDRNHRSVSILVSTPLPQQPTTSIALSTPHQKMHEVGNLSLTPMSEFTMHQRDESFGMDVSVVEHGQRLALGNGGKRTLSLSIKELVEQITQVEPYEPFWEHMKQLDLKDKRLTNLHKLNEFCEQLEELDASHNQVSQLHGVPRTVRHLRMNHNHLSDMAAWGHLSNLQYVDVSNNNLESLSGFRSLIHLRGLRADNNKIKSLDGIIRLDGLLSLRARGNCIESIDFAGSRLERLTDLDLNDNCVSQARNLQQLPSLTSLYLENNDLSDFFMGSTQVHWALKYLKLAGNKLEKIDVSQFPNLRLLYLDRNRLSRVSGLLKTKHLDSLSMREQLEGAMVDMSFLSEALEVRKLFLSGNLLTTFQPQVDFLNLQYLELANCGLETLSPEFGHMIANTRVLNLNFNALKDIKPLLGIVRLKKLHLAGNRLSRLRTTTCILSQFPTLSFTDLRNNPLTLGFYPPMTETRMVVRKDDTGEVSRHDPFTLGKADREKDTSYASRLDTETKMLRRLFEILALSGCQNLKMLDGLSVDRSVVDLKDRVWETLVTAGVLREPTTEEQALQKERDNLEEQQEVGLKGVEVSMVSEIWQGEDSFA